MNDLVIKGLPVTNGVIQAYERDGLAINTAPIEEYFVLDFLNLNNQSVVWELNNLSLMPLYLLANSPTGNIIFKVIQGGTNIYTQTISSNQSSIGHELPKIPFKNVNFGVTGTASRIWIACKQISILNTIMGRIL